MTGSPSVDYSQLQLKCKWYRVSSSYKVMRKWNSRAIFGENDDTLYSVIILYQYYFKYIKGMINSYFRSNIVRPISSQTNMSNVPTYTPTKYTEKGNNKYRKYKLIIVLLARASHRVMKSYWNVLWQKDRKANELLGRMLVLCDKNVAYSLFLGLDRLKQKAIQNKNNEKLLKGMMALLQRM
jgi:hypothetical protein